MRQLSRLHVFCAVAACLFGTRAPGFAIPFTGSAYLGGDSEGFRISGPSLSLDSAAPGGPAGFLFFCGAPCGMPAITINAFESPFALPGDNSFGAAGTRLAYSLSGELAFSGAPLAAGPYDAAFRLRASAPVSFAGALRGAVFSPPGCERSRDCTLEGPQVFRVSLRGAGTVTADGQLMDLSGDTATAYGYDYLSFEFSGTAAVDLDPAPVPEPVATILAGGGLVVLGGLGRRRLEAKKRAPRHGAPWLSAAGGAQK